MWISTARMLLIYSLLFFLMSAAVCHAQTAVDMFCDFENGTIGANQTVSNLTNSTYQSAAGSWSSGAASSNVTVSSDDSELRGPVSVGGTTYNGTGGTRGTAFNGNTTGDKRWTYNVPGSHSYTGFSVGLYLKTTVAFNTEQWDLVFLWSTSGGYAVVQGVNSGAGIGLRAHGTSSTYGSTVTIESNHLYWVTMKFSNSGSVAVSVYDPSDDWALVGTSTATQSGSGNADRLQLGVYNHDHARTGYVYYDNVILDWTDGTFPLLPDEAETSAVHWVSASGSASWANCAGETDPATYCSMATANANVSAGDTVMIKGGTYSTGIAPAYSGSAGNLITYRNVSGETVTISGAAIGIDLGGIDYIKVSGTTQYGIVIDGCTQGILGGDTNYCEIGYVKVTNTADASWHGSQLYSANYNWIHHCEFSTAGGCLGGSDENEVLGIGSEYLTSDVSQHNLIENCVLYHGGHNVLGMFGRYNTLRNSYLYNEAWSNSRGNRTLYMNGYSPYASQNLIEGNRFGYAALPCDDDAVSNMAISTSYNIMRYNAAYHHNSTGITFGDYSGEGKTVGSNNRAYNNTIFNSGYNISGTAAHTAEDAAVYFSSSNTTGNVLKNNLYYLRYQVHSGTTSGNTLTGNFDGNTQGDPLFANASGTPPADKTDSTLPNLSLSLTSPAIDTGGALTTVAVADTGSGTSLVVTDARFFQDGTWGPPGVMQADWIAVGTVSNIVQISSVNYSTNTITLEVSVSRSDGDSIWLYKKSDGTQVLYGSAPDYGAYENQGQSRKLNNVTGVRVTLH